MKRRVQDKQWDKSLVVGYSEDLPDVAPQIDENTLIIAADGGLRRLNKWGITPHAVIGDFDSITPEDEQSLRGKTTLIKKFPREKNKTDLELAVDYAIACQVKNILLMGAWGGRIDHSLGNIDLLYRLGSMHIGGSLFTSRGKIVLVNRQLDLELPLSTTVSLIPLSKTAKGVTTKGLYYPLENAVIKKGSTWTISNLTVDPLVSVTCKAGILIAVVEYENPR